MAKMQYMELCEQDFLNLQKVLEPEQGLFVEEKIISLELYLDPGPCDGNVVILISFWFLEKVPAVENSHCWVNISKTLSCFAAFKWM